MKRLLAVIPNDVGGRRDRAIVLTLVLTGRRRSEVLNLTAKDIEVDEERTFYCYRGKGGKLGRRELPRPAADSIRSAVADSGRSLPTMASHESLWQISQPTAYARFKRYLVAAGLPPTGFHVPRHSAAKLRRDAGDSVEAVSQFLDHSSLAVTTVYLRRLEVAEDTNWGRVAEAIGV